ncbi:hypothetical protein VNI00_010918, partial [Paramarasmius palmivorus]
FQVTESLPNVTGTIEVTRSFAGNIAVDRPGHPNDTLWFWGFERENGSLTAGAGERQDEPWLVWLNGGYVSIIYVPTSQFIDICPARRPGSSSQVGMMTENGPLQVQGDYSIAGNNFSWNRLADAFWVDQPVGVGFSTSDADGYVFDEDQLGQDFVGFLANLVKVFPSLANRPFHLTGESYAGVFIPYITKAIFSTPNPPVKLAKIAIGDGAMGSFAGYEEISTVNTLQTFPQIIGFDTEVFQYFQEQSRLCGYDLNLTYPQQNGPFPSLVNVFNTTTNIDAMLSLSQARKTSFDLNLKATLANQLPKRHVMLSERELAVREEKRMQWKRDLSGRPNGTLDPFYGCFLWEEMTEYAANFTFPWTQGAFDAYDIPDALNPEVPADPSVFLNDERVRTALHAPDKQWSMFFSFPFGNSTGITPAGNPWGDRSVEPAAFMSELASNASERGVGIVIYEGNSDSLVEHFGAEVVIQNTTFGGIQGFTRRPATPLKDDNGNTVGIIHQERNITYALFENAGHFVPRSVPEAAFVFLRDFILGNNTTGLVDGSNVVGGEDPTLMGAYLPADTAAIFYGSGSTVSSTVAPSETVAAWRSFIATAVTDTPQGSGTPGAGSNGAKGLENGKWILGIATFVSIVVSMIM